jgi:polyphosphate kinase 2 (PPK2 family)
MVAGEQDGMAIGGILTMNPSDITSDEALRARIEEDMRDSLDEELEMELEESRPRNCGHPGMATKSLKHWIATFISRSCSACRANWSSCKAGVQHNKLKIAVIFEGRDSAGKGGVIKRIT